MIGLGDSAEHQESIAPPTLYFGRWCARAMVPGDAPFAFDFLNDPDVADTRISAPPTELGTAQDWVNDAIDDPSYVVWILEDGDDGNVGMIELKELNLAHGTAEVGFLVVSSARRKGLATAALRAVSDWAFTALDLERLYLIHDVGNDGSHGVAKAGGYEFEGILRSARPTFDGGRRSSAIHSRLRADEPPHEAAR